ncbi:MAG TPA: hypothetical protein VG650_06440 [Mycobacteriales bacterium]|nr:hypothetical protein [Mycobacteriales bacterium]
MRINKIIAVLTSVCTLSLGASLAASAAPSANTFHATLTPSKIHVGQTYKITSSHARPSTTYNCVEIVTKGTAYGYSLGSLSNPVSTSSGHVTCKGPYLAFKATVSGKTRHCPQTKADLAAHVKCGIAVSTTDQSSYTSAFFTSVKK